MFVANLPAGFFDPSNEEFSAKINEARSSAYSDLINFMQQDGVRVGVLDATSSMRKRRAYIRESFNSYKCKVIIMEVICDKEELGVFKY